MRNLKEEKKVTKKKKGFTLIELIAVIAILAILGAVLVPKILGYQNKAKKSNYQTSAKTIIHAAQAYNADAPTAIADGNKLTTSISTATGSMTVLSAINANGDILKSDEYLTELSSYTFKQLANIAAGNFKVDPSGAVGAKCTSIQTTADFD